MIPGKQYTPEVILQIAWRRKWWFVLPAIVITAGVIVWTRQLKDVYKSDALILIVPPRVPQSLMQSSSRSADARSIEGRVNTISQQVLSRGRLEKIIEDLDLYPGVRNTRIMGDLVEQLRSGIAGPTIVRGDAFRVGFMSDNPRTAMRVADRLASLYIDESLRDREVLAEGTSQFLEAQLEEARRQLVNNEKRLEEYGRRHNGELPAQLQANLQGLHNTEMQLQSLEQSLNRDRDRHLVLERTLADALAGNFDAAAPREAARIERTEDLYNFLVAPRMAPAMLGGGVAGGGGGKGGGGGGGKGGGGGTQMGAFGADAGNARLAGVSAGEGKGGGGSNDKGGDAPAAKGSGDDSPKGGATPSGSRDAAPTNTAADQLRAAQAELRTMELRLTPEHPDIIRARRAVEELQRRADAEAAERPVDGDGVDPKERGRPDRLTEMRTALSRLDKQIADKTEAEQRLHEQQGTYQRHIEATPTRETELTELTRDYATLRSTYTSLLQKRLDAQLAANLERRQIGETFKLLEPATVSVKPFSPNRPRFYLFGLAGGIAFGLALAALLEYFDRSMRSEDDVRAALQLPVLAAIPMIRVPSSRRRGKLVPFSDRGAAVILATVAAITWRLLS